MPADPTATRRRLRPVLVRATALTAALGLTAAAAVYLSQRDRPGASPGTSSPALQAVALNGFGSCDALLRYYRDEAAERVGPYGLGGSPMYAMEGRAEMAQPPSPDARSAAGAADTGAKSSTGTNVQVAGVDEADLMKVVDGRLVSVTEGVLRVSQLGSGPARVLGTLKLQHWSPDQLLLDGDRGLLIGSAESGVAAGGVADDTVRRDIALRPDWTPLVRIVQLDLSDPAAPKVSRQLDVEGSLVGARLAGGRAQLALTTGAGRLPWVYPGNTDRRANEQATASNRDLVAKSTLDDWVPTYTAQETAPDGTPTGEKRTGRLLDCDKISAPHAYAGLDTLSLLSVGLGGEGLRSWTGAAVVASGSTLYATATHTYVATSSWATLQYDARHNADGSTMTSGEVSTTDIHQFDTTDNVLQYVASGRIQGSLLGQFAMDEYDGRLRVASTVQPMLFPRTSSGQVPPTRGLVTVLQQNGNELRTVGKLDNLGHDESVQGVRFAGPLGYLVTFRQTDPLFTLDLTDPTHPRQVGELKLLGYSAYLHPAGDGLLLGLGQDADASGRSKGMQLSVFDVKDPARPTRVGQVTLPNAWSGAEWDHHAFTLADDGLVLVPFSSDTGFAADNTGKYGVHDAGVLAVQLAGRGLGSPITLRPVGAGPTKIDYGRPTPAQDLSMRAAPMRTAVVDGTVYTLTAVGIAAHDPVTGTRLGFTRW